MFMDGFTVVVREYVIEKHPVLCIGIFLFLPIALSIIFFKRKVQNKAMAFVGTTFILCSLFIGISFQILRFLKSKCRLNTEGLCI